MRARGSTLTETEMAKVQERVKMAPKSNKGNKDFRKDQGYGGTSWVTPQAQLDVPWKS